jgi:hypothetical protein
MRSLGVGWGADAMRALGQGLVQIWKHSESIIRSDECPHLKTVVTEEQK